MTGGLKEFAQVLGEGADDRAQTHLCDKRVAAEHGTDLRAQDVTDGAEIDAASVELDVGDLLAEDSAFRVIQRRLRDRRAIAEFMVRRIGDGFFYFVRLTFVSILDPRFNESSIRSSVCDFRGNAVSTRFKFKDDSAIRQIG